MKMKKIFNFENFCVGIFYLLFYFSYDSNVRMLRLDSRICLYINILIICILLAVCIIKKRVKVNKNSVILLILLLVFNLISNTIYQTNFNTIFFMEIMTILAFIISICFSKEEFIRIFVKTLVAISITSLIGQYVLAPLALKNRLPYTLYYDAKSYFPMADLGIAFAKYNVGIQRNYSFFREPGVFQIFILLAMTFSMFWKSFNSKEKTVYNTILLLTLITTFSTMGFISVIILFIAYVLSSKDKNKMKFLMAFVVVIIIGMLFVTSSESGRTMFERTTNKLFENTDNESFSVRYYSIFNNVIASVNNPIFGMGYDRGFEYIINNLNQFGTRDVTGSLIIIAAVIGWPIALVCNYCFYKSTTYVLKKQKNIIKILIWFALFLSINSQNILYTNFFWIILFFACCREERGDNDV